MIVGLALFGILYGDHRNSFRDFRHCFPNIKRMIIEPLEKEGHFVKVFVCTYSIQDEEVLQTFKEMVNPEKVVWCEFSGSKSFTTKRRLFECLDNQNDLDVIIFSRGDMHYAIPVDQLSIDYEKFNFLFREQGHWDNLRYTTDNIYVWPHRMTHTVKKAIAETISVASSIGRMDTHNLYNILKKHVSQDEIHFISDEHALSDVNIFYTICRNGLQDRGGCLHPEVYERYYA